nr:RNA-binding domain-containing protein [uncultured Campylobacter sp.]
MKILDEIKNGESKILELKEKLPDNKSIAKTVIAFANTAGGKIIVGINDKLKITGVDANSVYALKDKIVSVIFDSCSPDILPEIYTININGKLLLVIEIFRGNLMPYFLKSEGKSDGVYIRVGATNRKASPQIIEELQRHKRYVSFDEEINYDITVREPDMLPIKARFAKIGKTLNDEKLRNLKLIKTDRGITYPTNALLILLGKFPHCTVKCARFKGVTMETFIDKKEYRGNIFSVIENTQSFILNHINLSAKIEGLYRTDSYEIPIVALREALINALIHRDYANFGRDVKVGVYDDIVNIVSPGALPNIVTVEDILRGRSEIRNKVIANVFKEIGLIEQWGSGISRIMIACKKVGLKQPRIREGGDFVDVEFYRPKIEEMSDKK